MHVSASVRPRGLKRGVTTKKVHELMGWERERGLSEVCMQLDLTALTPSEAGFLHFLEVAIASRKCGHKITIADDTGRELCTATYDKDAE